MLDLVFGTLMAFEVYNPVRSSLPMGDYLEGHIHSSYIGIWRYVSLYYYLIPIQAK